MLRQGNFILNKLQMKLKMEEKIDLNLYYCQLKVLKIFLSDQRELKIGDPVLKLQKDFFPVQNHQGF